MPKRKSNKQAKKSTTVEYLEYYENYAKHFEIKPRFNKTVASIKLEDEGWKVVT